jgi:hypothetical protein
LALALALALPPALTIACWRCRHLMALPLPLPLPPGFCLTVVVGCRQVKFWIPTFEILKIGNF